MKWIEGKPIAVGLWICELADKDKVLVNIEQDSKENILAIIDGFVQNINDLELITRSFGPIPNDNKEITKIGSIVEKWDKTNPDKVKVEWHIFSSFQKGAAFYGEDKENRKLNVIQDGWYMHRE